MGVMMNVGLRAVGVVRGFRAMWRVSDPWSPLRVDFAVREAISKLRSKSSAACFLAAYVETVDGLLESSCRLEIAV